MNSKDYKISLPDKVQAIENVTVQTDKKALRNFIGIISWYEDI